LFLGTYLAKCDSSGRCRVPAKFLTELGGVGADIYLVDCGDHLVLCKKEVFFAALSSKSETPEFREQYALSATNEICVGSKGRIRLPDRYLKQIGGAGTEVTFAGCGNRVEIRDREYESKLLNRQENQFT